MFTETEIETDPNRVYVFLTKRVRVPIADILEVRPTFNGRGSMVVTRRGMMRVCENYAELRDVVLSRKDGAR